jgi:hypothetical protein
MDTFGRFRRQHAIDVSGRVHPQQLLARGRRGFDPVQAGMTVVIQRPQHAFEACRTLCMARTGVVPKTSRMGVEPDHVAGYPSVGVLRRRSCCHSTSP